MAKAQSVIQLMEKEIKSNRLAEVDDSSGVGYDIKQVVREYAISGLNIPYAEAEEFAEKVAQHLADGGWLEIHIAGKSVQWNRGKEL